MHTHACAHTHTHTHTHTHIYIYICIYIFIYIYIYIYKGYIKEMGVEIIPTISETMEKEAMIRNMIV